MLYILFFFIFTIYRHLQQLFSFHSILVKKSKILNSVRWYWTKWRKYDTWCLHYCYQKFKGHYIVHRASNRQLTTTTSVAAAAATATAMRLSLEISIQLVGWSVITLIGIVLPLSCRCCCIFNFSALASREIVPKDWLGIRCKRWIPPTTWVILYRPRINT